MEPEPGADTVHGNSKRADGRFFQIPEQLACRLSWALLQHIYNEPLLQVRVCV